MLFKKLFYILIIVVCGMAIIVDLLKMHYGIFMTNDLVQMLFSIAGIISSFYLLNNCNGKAF